MATARVLRRALTAPPPPSLLHPLRSHQTIARRRYPPPPPHDFATPSDFLGSWKNPPPTSDPREAEIRLDRLRKDYAKQVKQLRREYLYEMDIQRAEQKRKDDAKREAVRLSKEERKAAAAAAADTRAAERKTVQETFKQMLIEERAKKLEYWRAREARMEEKRNQKKLSLRQQSSAWIAEENLEERILKAMLDTTSLV